MPLLLASTFQKFENLHEFEDDLNTWTVACVTTAALAQIDDCPDRPNWVLGEIDAVRQHAKKFFEYDLRGKNLNDFQNDLSDCDLIYFIGGNTYCLLEAINQSGFREFSKAHLDQGRSIWGGSAGAIVNGPDIDFIRLMDEPEKANLTSTKGMSFTILYIMPHWKGAHHQEALECLKENAHVDILCLTDKQAVYLDGNKMEIL